MVYLGSYSGQTLCCLQSFSCTSHNSTVSSVICYHFFAIFHQQIFTSSLVDCRPVAFTPIVVKCLQRVVVKHIKASFPFVFDLTSTRTKPIGCHVRHSPFCIKRFGAQGLACRLQAFNKLLLLSVITSGWCKKPEW